MKAENPTLKDKAKLLEGFQDIKQLEEHLERLGRVFREVELLDQEEKTLEVFNLARAYYNDAVFFKNKGELLKALELESYCWGLLDALAIMRALKVPKELEPYFKTEFS